MGVADRMTMVMGRAGDDPATRANTVRAAWNVAHNFAAQHRDVVLAVAADEGGLAELIAQLGTVPSQAANAFNGALSVFLLNFLNEGGAAQRQAELRGADAVMVFDAAMAQQKLWPAVSPTASRSLLLDKGGSARDHQQIARDAIDLLQRYREMEASGSVDDQTAGTARRLRNFLTQPFYTAEPWSGIPGESVRLVETLVGARAIMDGKLSDIPEEAFLYVGTVEQARDKARRMERAQTP
jgi:F0F1-type ATP synthase beta subunit